MKELELIQDSKQQDVDITEKGYWIQHSSFYMREFIKGTPNNVRLSNFCMKILYHFKDDSQDTKRLIQLQNANNGLTTCIEVLSSQLTPEKFETILKSNQSTFLGNSFQLKKILMDLMIHEKQAVHLNRLAWNIDEKFYVFSNGILKDNKFIASDDGLININKNTYYIPAFANANLKDRAYDEERKFIYKQGKTNLNNYANLLFRAYGTDGLIGLSYLINSLLRDIIIKETNFFPFLFLFGQAGTGKSTYIHFLTSIFGENDAGTPLKGSTLKSLGRTLAQKTNGLVFFKEYTNGIDENIVNFLKNAYDLVSYKIAQQTTDSRTHTFFVDSGLIMDGNELPTAESAMFDRFIILNFNNNTFTDENNKAFKTLMDESKIGFGQIIKEILSFREDFSRDYTASYRSALKELKNKEFNGFNLKDLPERNLKHVAFILTPFLMLSKNLKMPLSIAQIADKLIQDAIEKNSMLFELKDVNVFWDAISADRQLDSRAKILEDITFKVDHLEKILYIKLNECYTVYVQHCKQSDISYVDKTTLKKLLTTQKYFLAGSQKGRGNDYIKKGFGSCYRFSFERVEYDTRVINLGGKDVLI